MLVAPLWEESVNVKTCYGINTQPKQKQTPRVERGWVVSLLQYHSAQIRLFSLENMAFTQRVGIRTSSSPLPRRTAATFGRRELPCPESATEREGAAGTGRAAHSVLCCGVKAGHELGGWVQGSGRPM